MRAAIARAACRPLGDNDDDDRAGASAGGGRGAGAAGGALGTRNKNENRNRNGGLLRQHKLRLAVWPIPVLDASRLGLDTPAPRLAAGSVHSRQVGPRVDASLAGELRQALTAPTCRRWRRRSSRR
jgi:hypothetical protein